ncbi:MAG TPA: hypothetical protein VFT66_02320 [Roseiflexaceae bacterium]|jgi:hypothetical protein|nr:hypothetical protein [Roseiflexaceae bacterium]
MRRHSLFAPVSVLVIGLVIIVLLLGTPWGYSDAPLSFAYTASEETATAGAYISPDDINATNTAAALPTSGTSSGTSATSASTSATTSSTSATTAVSTIAPTRTTGARTALPTSTIAASTQIPTATPEPSPTPLADYQCVPGQQLAITGTGPAGAGVLLLFDDRVVGGGTVQSNGVFSLQLNVGDEEPGVYPVVVQVRGTQQELFNKTCFVPAITPTPAPLSRGP